MIRAAAVLFLVMLPAACGGPVPESPDIADSIVSDAAPDEGPVDAVPLDEAPDRSASDEAAENPGGDSGTDKQDSDDLQGDQGDLDVTDATREQCPEFGAGVVVAMLDGTPLAEVSGLAASLVHEGVLWGHNDSGDAARVFAIVIPGPDESGAVPVTVEFRLRPGPSRLDAVSSIGSNLALDWEDIAVGPFPGIDGDAIFVADTGTNGAGRNTVRLLVFPEPRDLSGGDISDIRIFEFVYDDGLHDCEAMFVDRLTSDVFFVVKEEIRKTSAVYSIGAAAMTGLHRVPLIARKVGEIASGLVTGADMSPDSMSLLVRNYGGQVVGGTECAGLLFSRKPGMSVAEMIAGEGCLLPNFAGEPYIEIQGEAIAFAQGGDGFFTVPERLPIVSEDYHQYLRFWPVRPPAAVESDAMRQ